MNSHLYFAYGSNLSHEGMAGRCPDSEPVGVATLAGWELTFRGVADIRRSASRKTYGALWRISDRDRDRLDTYEGYPSLYGREKVTVRIDRAELVAATYVMRDDYLGLPSPAYLDTIRRGYDKWGLPKLALDIAVAKVENHLFDLGIRRFEPDGAKRLRPV